MLGFEDSLEEEKEGIWRMGVVRRCGIVGMGMRGGKLTAFDEDTTNK